MAFFIFQLYHNTRCKFKDDRYDDNTVSAIFEHISELLDEYGIIIDDLTR